MHLEELKCRVNIIFYAEDSFSILSKYFTKKYFSSLRSCPDFPYFSSGKKIKQTKPEKKDTWRRRKPNTQSETRNVGFALKDTYGILDLSNL